MGTKPPTPSGWREAVQQGWAGGSGSSLPKRAGDEGRGQTLPALLIFGHTLLVYNPWRKEPRAHGDELLLRTLLPNPPAPTRVGYSLSRSTGSTDKKQCQDVGSSELHLPNFPLCKGSRETSHARRGSPRGIAKGKPASSQEQPKMQQTVGRGCCRGGRAMGLGRDGHGMSLHL